MAPESAVPSALVYRGSILTLVVATLLTVFLLIRPPAEKSQASLVRELPTSTAAISATATPTPPRTATQAGSGDETPEATPATPETPGASPTAAETAEATPTTGPRVHIVAAGDTLSGIAAEYDTTVDELERLNPGIDENINIGDEVIVP
jgi:LysM repeat protein